MYTAYQEQITLKKGELLEIGPLVYYVGEDTTIEISGILKKSINAIRDFKIKGDIFKSEYFVNKKSSFGDVNIFEKTKERDVLICKKEHENNMYMNIVREDSFTLRSFDISFMSYIFTLFIDKENGVLTL